MSKRNKDIPPDGTRIGDGDGCFDVVLVFLLVAVAVGGVAALAWMLT